MDPPFSLTPEETPAAPKKDAGDPLKLWDPPSEHDTFDFQPEELHDFTLSWVRFSVAPLDNGARGAFIDDLNTPIQIWPAAESIGPRRYIGDPEDYNVRRSLLARNMQMMTACCCMR